MNFECRVSKEGILPLESLRVQGQCQPIGFLRLQKTERSDSTLRNSAVHYSAVLRFASPRFCGSLFPDNAPRPQSFQNPGTKSVLAWPYSRNRNNGVMDSIDVHYSGCHVCNNFYPLYSTCSPVRKSGKRNICMTTGIVIRHFCYH